MSEHCHDTAVERADPPASSSIRPPKPARWASRCTRSRTRTASPPPMLRTGGRGPAAVTASTAARATSRTSTKSRYADRSPSRSTASGSGPASRNRAATRPGSPVGGAPGPTGLPTRSTTASRPEAATATVPASLVAPYGPSGRVAAASVALVPGSPGPYSAADPRCTRRARGAACRSAAHRAAGPRALTSARVTASPPVAPAQLITASGAASARVPASRSGGSPARSMRRPAPGERPAPGSCVSGRSRRRATT